MNRILSVFLLISSIIIVASSCSKKSENTGTEKGSREKFSGKSNKKIVKIPKFYLSRTIMELQIRIIRSFKVGAFNDLNKYLIGGLIKEPCKVESSDFDWKGCFGDMDKQSLKLIEKKSVNCPSEIPAGFKSKACPATMYCKQMTLIVKNKDGEKRSVELNDLAKIAGKWWVIGKVKCLNSFK